jgi:hypothetical protein
MLENERWRLVEKMRRARKLQGQLTDMASDE